MPVPGQWGLILTVIGMHNKAIQQNHRALWDGGSSAFGEWLGLVWWTIMELADHVQWTVYQWF